jgi:hypothetical protein
MFDSETDLAYIAIPPAAPSRFAAEALSGNQMRTIEPPTR